MKSFKFILLLMLAIVTVSCSKSDDDDSVDPFFKINGINVNEFSDWYGWGNGYYSPNIIFIYTAFRTNTDDLYVWFCDENKKVICTTNINVPKQIVEDQGYGNLVTCERYDNYYNALLNYMNALDDVEFYNFTPNYKNMKNKISYLFVYKDRKLYAHKVERDLNDNFKIINWYKNSYLLGSNHKDYFFCVSENGGKVTMFEEKDKTNFNDIFNDGIYSIPIDYAKCITLRCSKLIDMNMGFGIDVDSFDNGEELFFTAPSPFDSSEKFIINNASLLESTAEYYLIECQVTAYSGEKKTVKIKINLSENKAEIVG